MENELQAIATIFALVNPAICAAMFMHIEKGRAPEAQILDATKAVFVIAAILVLAAFFGARILHLFGISLDAFSVAGGTVLAWIGFSMLSGHGSVATPKSLVGSAEGNEATPSLAPLILFAASPGTITGVITISASHTKLSIPISALLAIVLVLVLTWVVLVLTVRFGRSSSSSSMTRDLVTRYMGLIVIAMGIQFALTGLKSFINLG